MTYHVKPVPSKIVKRKTINWFKKRDFDNDIDTFFSIDDLYLTHISKNIEVEMFNNYTYSPSIHIDCDIHSDLDNGIELVLERELETDLFMIDETVDKTLKTSNNHFNDTNISYDIYDLLTNDYNDNLFAYKSSMNSSIGSLTNSTTSDCGNSFFYTSSFNGINDYIDEEFSDICN